MGVKLEVLKNSFSNRCTRPVRLAMVSGRKIYKNWLRSALLDLIVYEPVLEGGEGSKVREGLKVTERDPESGENKKEKGKER